MLFLCSLIFSVLSVSGAAPPWSECSQCLPPPTIPCHGAPCHYAGDTEPLCWGHGVSERGRDTRRLVTIAWSRGQLITRPAAAQPPCRSKYFLVRYRKYFSCSPSHRERVPASSSHQIFNIQFVILNITLCFPSTYTTKMSLLSPDSSVKLQRHS